jgi:hypothetical protein
MALGYLDSIKRYNNINLSKDRCSRDRVKGLLD